MGNKTEHKIPVTLPTAAFSNWPQASAATAYPSLPLKRGVHQSGLLEEVLNENGKYQISFPQTFSFKALMDTVSRSATVKCSSSLVSIGRIRPHVGDFSLDTQRVEVYSSFMGLTKSSAFWKSSSVNLSSPGQKKKI